jgi:hypothetical protein
VFWEAKVKRNAKNEGIEFDSAGYPHKVPEGSGLSNPSPVTVAPVAENVAPDATCPACGEAMGLHVTAGEESPFGKCPAPAVSLPPVTVEPIDPHGDCLIREHRALKEVQRLTALINTPEIIDFVKAVQIEAVHQRERWGTKQDEGKTAADWFWLLGYLAGKALHSDKVGDHKKLLHHIITTAAACANWHAQVLGKCDMRPGIATPPGEIS